MNFLLIVFTHFGGGGADRDRTNDLLNAIRTLQLDPGVSGDSRIDEIETQVVIHQSDWLNSVDRDGC